MKTPTFSRSAFSLIEILIVVGIIGIISSFAVPAATKMIRGSDVTRASQMLTDQLSTARQIAVSRNKQVEVRFLRFADPEQPGESVGTAASWKVRGIQLMEVTSSGVPVPIGSMQRLPNTMVINDGPFSSLFGSTSAKPLAFKAPGEIDPPMPRLPADKAKRYTFASFRFLPDGSTNLKLNENWYITMHSIADAVKLDVAPADAADAIRSINYFTVQIDPVSGATRSYRPQIGS
jgi:uncharacterized protein (TIGR02596 family)